MTDRRKRLIRWALERAFNLDNTLISIDDLQMEGISAQITNQEIAMKILAHALTDWREPEAEIAKLKSEVVFAEGIVHKMTENENRLAMFLEKEFGNDQQGIETSYMKVVRLLTRLKAHESPNKPAPKFKVGDVVRDILLESPHYNRYGKITSRECVSSGISGFHVTFPDKYTSVYYLESSLELVWRDA